MIRSVTLEAALDVVSDAVGISPTTVVALPPSDADPIWDEMRVIVGGVLISRAFDPGDDIVTGFPFLFSTEGGDELLTEASETLTTEVAA